MYSPVLVTASTGVPLIQALAAALVAHDGHVFSVQPWDRDASGNVLTILILVRN